jgi:hypothetical protein
MVGGGLGVARTSGERDDVLHATPSDAQPEPETADALRLPVAGNLPLPATLEA